MGTMGQGPREPWAFMETAKAKGTKAQRPMAPLWGGKYTREKARIGGSVSPLPVPYVYPPRWPPLS